MQTAPSSPSDYTRRRFVSKLALAGATLPLARLAAQESAAPSAAPAASPSSSAAGTTCVHVFAKPLQWLSYEATAELVAETGYGGIDYAVRRGGHVLPERVEDDLPRAVEAARRAGLRVEMITTAIVDPHDRYTEPLLKTAARLGVKYYRFGNLAYDEKLGVWPSLQKHKTTMRELADMNRHFGIHGAYQNHAGPRVGGAIWDIYELIRDLDSRWIGVQYDIRHATVEGGRSWPVALELVHPWVRCTDIKDFRWQQSPGRATVENTPLGEGIVDFELYFKRVRALNITGPMSVHLEYPPFEHDPRPLSAAEKRAEFAAAMKKDLVTLRGWMAQHQIA